MVKTSIRETLGNNISSR